VLSVRDAHASGAAAWPGVGLSLEDFARHVDARLAQGNAAEAIMRHGDDLFLACACAQGNQRAIELFSKHLLGAVPAMVARVLPQGALVEELVQSLHEAMLVGREGSPPQIAGYRGSGSLAGWVRISAMRAAIRMKNRVARFASEAHIRSSEAPTIGPERRYMQREYGPAFAAAFREALVALPSPTRDLLRRYYVDGLTIDQLAERDKVHRATAARRVEAARKLVLAEVRRRAAERLRIGGDEIDSLLRQVASVLDVSIRQLAGDDG
jgi:RNA polymerase sigma-70 factor (ECF subfamily)